MFTGIIRYQGKLTQHVGNELTIAVPRAITTRLKPGGSIAVNGVCLTVETKGKEQGVCVSIMPTTAKSTTLGSLPVGSRVNLELPLRLTDPLDGHLVSGHVDGVGMVKNIQQRGNSRLVTIAAPRALTRFLASKGSVAVDGASLTIQQSHGTAFTVGLIPETMRRTTLQTLRIGSRVNIEIDIVARYLERSRQT